jgi:hypothetical protein
MAWEVVEDLGVRPAKRRFRKMAKHYMCKCPGCGRLRVMTASELSAYECNEVRGCLDCKRKRAKS